MQIDMVKNAGGVFVPAFDHDLPRFRGDNRAPETYALMKKLLGERL